MAAQSNTSNSKLIVCFGDSNTEGGHRGGVGHPSFLAGMVKTYQVVNAGKGGEFTKQGLARFEDIIKKYQPSYVLLLEGTNDVSWSFSPAKVAANLGRMVDIARKYGATPIVATLPPYTGKSSSVPKYNKAIAAMADKRKIALADIYSALIETWKQLSSDGMHYNAAGARIVAKMFVNTMFGKFTVGTKDDDTLSGNKYNDTLQGLGGNDMLYGKAGTDRLEGGKGSDSLFGGSGKDTLKGGSGADLLDGGKSNDTLFGESGADILKGKTGHDRLEGGTGNDTLFGGTGNDTLKGNAGNDHLNGDNGADLLKGRAGKDTLVGGLGKDTLVGGAGEDVFLFDAKLNKKTNVDLITDFKQSKDRIQLATSIFKKLTEGALLSENFRKSKRGKALDENDYIIYNTKTGALLYDRDGNGKASAVQFATLKNKPKNISASDFFVV